MKSIIWGIILHGGLIFVYHCYDMHGQLFFAFCTIIFVEHLCQHVMTYACVLLYMCKLYMCKLYMDVAFSLFVIFRITCYKHL